MIDRARGIGSTTVVVEALERILERNTAGTTIVMMQASLTEHVANRPRRSLRERASEAEALYWQQMAEWCRTRDSLIMLLRIMNSHELFEVYKHEELYPEMEEK